MPENRSKRREESLRRPPWPDRRLALALALLAFVVYNANGRLIAAGDSYAARFQPFALWGEGSLYLDSIREVTAQGHSNPYWIQPTPDGRWASLYPVVVPVVVSPLYAPAVAYLRWKGWTGPRMDRAGQLMEKGSASLIASAAVGWMFLLLRRRGLGQGDAALLTLAFAFGTNTWVTGSQALWQHGLGELLVVGALWFVTQEPTPAHVLAAGAFTGLLAANQPPDAILAAGFCVWALSWARRRIPLFALAAAVPVALVITYNLIVFHQISGGSGAIGLIEIGFFDHPVPQGIAGLLVSPARGLFVYSPFFLFLPLLFRRTLAEPDSRTLTACVATAVVLQIDFYACTDWRGGHSWGYRFLTDLAPLLIWLLAPIVASLRRPAKLAFVACCLFSVWVQAIGAFKYTGISDPAINDPADVEWRNVWSIEACPILVERRQARAPASLGRLLFPR
ncbi:MAG TPA: hypothetical protein VKK31_32310 [Thermoanaerobaculia bacterium]|nr:hypothetical protein [Thermoanaerobaculia bacterium]